MKGQTGSLISLHIFGNIKKTLRRDSLHDEYSKSKKTKLSDAFGKAGHLLTARSDAKSYAKNWRFHLTGLQDRTK